MMLVSVDLYLKDPIGILNVRRDEVNLKESFLRTLETKLPLFWVQWTGIDG